MIPTRPHNRDRQCVQTNLIWGILFHRSMRSWRTTCSFCSIVYKTLALRQCVAAALLRHNPEIILYAHRVLRNLFLFLGLCRISSGVISVVRFELEVRTGGRKLWISEGLAASGKRALARATRVRFRAIENALRGPRIPPPLAVEQSP
jgi:hypothetical protein